MVQTKNLEDLVRDLPPDLRRETEDFVHFLLARHVHRSGNKLRQDWAGALRDYRHQYTSLELQQKSLQWRGD